MFEVSIDSGTRVLPPAHHHTNDRTAGETAVLVAKLVGWFFAWVGLGLCWDYPAQRMDEIKALLWPELGLPATFPAREGEWFTSGRPDYGSLESSSFGDSNSSTAVSTLFSALSREEPISNEILRALRQELALNHPVHDLASSYVHEVRSLESLQAALNGQGFEVRRMLEIAIMTTLPNAIRSLLQEALSGDEEPVQRLKQAVQSELESWETGGKRASVRAQLMGLLEREIGVTS